MNIRRVTFETDMHHVQSLRNKLCSLDINKSMKPVETEYEEATMDEVRELMDEIINADITAKYRIKTL